MFRTSTSAVALLTLATITSASFAQGSVLDRIRQGDTINFGYVPTIFPFSYDDRNNKPAGFVLDLCQQIVGSIRDELGAPPARINTIPVSYGSRVAMVVNGTIDALCSLSPEILRRDDQVSFLDPMFIGTTKFILPKSSSISRIDELAGKRVVSFAGTTNAVQALELNKRRRLNMSIILVKDARDAFPILDAGRAEAILGPDITLLSWATRLRIVDNYRFLDESLADRSWSIMVSRRDTAFKNAANHALRKLMRSGQFNAIYTKWFLAPIELEGITINIPMSDALSKKVKAARNAE